MIIIYINIKLLHFKMLYLIGKQISFIFINKKYNLFFQLTDECELLLIVTWSV